MTRAEPSLEVDELARRVIGAAIEVHRHLGPGYLESVYETAMQVELAEQRIPFVGQFPFVIRYKNRPVGDGRLDFLVGDRLVVEIKAVEAIAQVHRAQAISYLKALRLELALLINFHVPILKDGIERIVYHPS